MSSILDKIVADKRIDIDKLKRTLPLEYLRTKTVKKIESRFGKRLANDRSVNIIAELKKASPSRGILVADFDVDALARKYSSGGAAALSVLTEERYFKGSLDYIKIASGASDLPVLCKDFIIDEYQIYLAKLAGAEAILLIASILDLRTIESYISISDRLGLDCLVEVHDKKELTKAIDGGARIIGVNNRNLEDFSISLERSEELSELIPAGVTKVAESGIFSPDDIRRLRKVGFNCFLIGEALVKSDDPAKLLQSMIKA